ncbi:hypothetical protein BDF14DRAFT_1724532, partial [Spinellus fusiger]
LIFVATLAWAVPIKDVSVTSVDLSESAINTQGDTHLYVTVTRVDDLVDDDGTLLAERLMAVRIQFDVLQQKLHCNKVPVEIGMSNIQIEAQMAVNPSLLSIDSAAEAAVLEDAFETGLATVEVTVSLMDELVTEEGLTFRRLLVKERITEINGQSVVQTEAGQQILDVFENNAIVQWKVDPLTNAILPPPTLAHDKAQSQLQETIASNAQTTGCTGAFVVNWWNAQTSLVRGLISGALCALLFGLAIVLRQLMTSEGPYEIVHASPEAIWQEKESDKHPLLS